MLIAAFAIFVGGMVTLLFIAPVVRGKYLVTLMGLVFACGFLDAAERRLVEVPSNGSTDWPMVGYIWLALLALVMVISAVGFHRENLSPCPAAAASPEGPAAPDES